MTTVDVIGLNGKAAGKAELPDALFNTQTNIPLIHQVVTAQLAAGRQGTHSTKTRADVSGGGAKPWRQKGTGRARQGSRRAPQWKGGGVVFGPHPRSYAQKTPKKMIAAALLGVLSDRARDGLIFVIDSIVKGETPSTKAATTTLAHVGNYANLLVILDRDDYTGWLSLRNLPEVHLLAVDQLNAYDVVTSDAVVFTKAALELFIAGASYSNTVRIIVADEEDEVLDGDAGEIDYAPEEVAEADEVTEEAAEPTEDTEKEA